MSTRVNSDLGHFCGGGRFWKYLIEINLMSKLLANNTFLVQRTDKNNVSSVFYPPFSWYVKDQYIGPYPHFALPDLSLEIRAIVSFSAAVTVHF